MVARARGLDRDRLGEELRLGRERLRRHAELGEGAFRQPRLGGETLGQAGDRRLEQLDRPLGRGRQHRREGDSHDVESLGERQRVEVADRDEPSLADEDDGVLLRGVQLRLEPPPRERERVVRGRVELGDAAEAERVLQVPRRTGLQQPASVEERPEGRGRRVKHVEVAAKRLEVERRGDVGGLEQALRVGVGERGDRGREAVVAEQGEPLLRSRVEAVENPVGEVGVRRQIGHADRAQRAHHRRRSVVESLRYVLEQFEPHSRCPAREAVHDEEQLCAYDVRRRRIALADPVLEDQAAVELRQLVRLDTRALAHADAGREPVHRRVGIEHLLDDCARGANAGLDAGVESNALAAARDAQQLVERERRAGERDRHRATVSRMRPSL